MLLVSYMACYCWPVKTIPMDKYILLLTLIGAAVFCMAWMPTLTRKIGISYSVIYVMAGAVLYILLPDMLPSPLPQHNETITLRLSEMVVIISLMGTGIKIDRPFTLKNWRTPLRLISIAMILCIGAATSIGYTYLGLDIGAAILLGAVLAPTDPVLASDVQVGPPNEKVKSESKFALTAEAGLNDGMAFPFTWLAITLTAMRAGSEDSLLHWLGYDLLYRIIAGIILGYLSGRAVGFLIFSLAKKYKFLHTRDGFLAIALTLLVYGITELLHGYGFIAVFVSGLTLRHYEKGHDYHDELHSFTDQIERLLVAILLILLGGALVSGILSALSWKMVLFTAIFLLVIRPVAAYLSMYRLKIHYKEKLAISFLGIRGLGSVFYLAFAFHEIQFPHERQLWSMVSFTILCSIVLHGFTASPIMKRLKKDLPEERIPD
ncbi:MAG: sodium:proton antiporter [Sphingobacteriales bacterium]|nr:MAG: sodium:proton antiporter [Sphingobacteriales bacterium]